AAVRGRRVRLTARFALDGHEPEAEPLEPELAAHLLEQPHAAVTAIAEVEVGADDHESGAETPDEHLTHEVLGRLVAARVVEVQDHRAVEEARLAEELDLLLECGEQLRSALGPHHLRRVTVEREAYGFETTRIRELAHEPQHCLVAEMDAVIRT